MRQILAGVVPDSGTLILVPLGSAGAEVGNLAQLYHGSLVVAGEGEGISCRSAMDRHS